MYPGKLETSSNIAWHRPQSATSRVEEELIQKSMRALVNTTDPLERLRLLCFSKGAAGILVLARIFRKMDKRDSRKLSREQFFNAINETELGLSEKDAMDLFDRFDPEKTGFINLDEFFAGVRPPMAESRRAIVEQAYRKLDKMGRGVTVPDIRAAYDVTSNPRYMSGEESGDLILKTFLACFETEGVHNGEVTLEEFMNFYSGISVSIDNDCYFDLMMRQCYRL